MLLRFADCGVERAEEFAPGGFSEDSSEGSEESMMAFEGSA